MILRAIANKLRGIVYQTSNAPVHPRAAREAVSAVFTPSVMTTQIARILNNSMTATVRRDTKEMAGSAPEVSNSLDSSNLNLYALT